MNDESDRLRAAIRTQEAIVRTMTDELRREAPETEGLRAQANAESARLVSTMANLSRARPQPASGKQGPAPRPSHDAPTHPTPHASERRRRVLVVDDDDAARNAIASWLAQEYDVSTASDGVEGLHRAQETLPDAIIADVQMPRMDGIAMVQRIRVLRAPALVPVIFLTGHSAPENVTAGFSVGGIGYLVKPVDLELLDDELRWAVAAGASSDPAR